MKAILNWLKQSRYQSKLAWCKKNDVLHYALAEAGSPTEVMKWPKKKLLWMRDIDRYLSRGESRIKAQVERWMMEREKRKV